MTKLSVNVDHVATLRQARGVSYPDPAAAAAIAEASGADGITIHIRLDRRHIQEHDVVRLRAQVGVKLNLEMCAEDEMVEVALRTRPDQVTLVPEKPSEITTEGGLDLRTQSERIVAVAEQLAAAGISTSLFLDPDPHQLEKLVSLGTQVVPGFEINTDRYTRVSGDDRRRELEKVRDIAAAGAADGLRVYAGHGLTVDNVTAIADIAEIEELNIGHALVSRAVLVGMAEAVREMLAAMGCDPTD